MVVVAVAATMMAAAHAALVEGADASERGPDGGHPARWDATGVHHHVPVAVHYGEPGAAPAPDGDARARANPRTLHAALDGLVRELAGAPGGPAEDAERRRALARVAEAALLALASGGDGRSAAEAPPPSSARVGVAGEVPASGGAARAGAGGRPGRREAPDEMHVLTCAFLFVSTAAFALLLFAPDAVHALASMGGRRAEDGDDEEDGGAGAPRAHRMLLINGAPRS